MASALLLTFLLSHTLNFQTVPNRSVPYAADFMEEYIGGWIVAHGDSSRLYDPDYAKRLEHDTGLLGFTWRSDSGFYPLSYPPFYYVLVSPLSNLPYRVAAFLWLGLQGVALFLAVCLLAWKFTPARVLSLSLLPFVVAFFPPVMLSLALCQKGTLLLLLFVLAFLLLRSRRRAAAGIVFGAVAFKPQLMLVVLFAMFVKRQWRFLLGVSLTVAAFALVAACTVGIGSELDWLRSAAYLRLDPAKSQCWLGFARLMLLPAHPFAAFRVAGLAVLMTLFIVIELLRGPLEFDSLEFAAQFSGLVAATLLVSPHVYIYDVTLLLLGFYLIASVVPMLPRTSRWHRSGIYVALAVLFIVAGKAPRFSAVPIQIGVLAMLALLILAWRVREGLRMPAPGHGAARDLDDGVTSTES